MSEIYDKNGLPVKVGDILKVYHFTGARNKKYYMYKQITAEGFYPSGKKYFLASHLDLTGDFYHIHYDSDPGHIFEVVKGIDPFWDERPKKVTENE